MYRSRLHVVYLPLPPCTPAQTPLKSEWTAQKHDNTSPAFVVRESCAVPFLPRYTRLTGRFAPAARQHPGPVKSAALWASLRVLGLAATPPPEVDPKPFLEKSASFAGEARDPPAYSRRGADVSGDARIRHALCGADVADSIAEEIASERLAAGFTCLVGGAQDVLDFAILVVVRAGGGEHG